MFMFVYITSDHVCLHIKKIFPRPKIISIVEALLSVIDNRKDSHKVIDLHYLKLSKSINKTTIF